jgi:hypothetical protein
MTKRGEIVDYDVPEGSVTVNTGQLSADETVPLLVVAVDDEAKSYSGFAFLPNGGFEYVTVTEPEPEAPAPKYDAQTGQRIDGGSDAPVTAPETAPVTAPEPATVPETQAQAPTGNEQTA